MMTMMMTTNMHYTNTTCTKNSKKFTYGDQQNMQ